MASPGVSMMPLDFLACSLSPPLGSCPVQNANRMHSRTIREWDMSGHMQNSDFTYSSRWVGTEVLIDTFKLHNRLCAYVSCIIQSVIIKCMYV